MSTFVTSFCENLKYSLYNTCCHEQSQAFFTSIKNHFFSFTEKPKQIHDYLIKHLTQFNETLDHALPNWTFQSIMDQTGQCIQKKIDQVGQYARAQLGIHSFFNEWLNQNEGETQFQQLLIYLCKLPLKAIYTFVLTIEYTLEFICYAAVHPIKAINELVQYFVHRTYSLTKPETWCVIGASMATASLRQALLSGNPLFLAGAGIGPALMIGGLAGTALKAAMAAEEGLRQQSAKKAVIRLLMRLPEWVTVRACRKLVIGKAQETALYCFNSSMEQIQKQYEEYSTRNQFPVDENSSFETITSNPNLLKIYKPFNMKSPTVLWPLLNQCLVK